MAKKHVVAGACALALLLAGCGGDSQGEGGGGASDGEISGKITVLTNRTDLVDNLFQEYKATFEDKYPGTEVEFEGITDYEGEVTTRMSTEHYGDALIIPTSVSADKLADFFEPLGTAEEITSEWDFSDGVVYDGTSYGIATAGTANGVVYNKKVWSEAGHDSPPATPEEFVAALQDIQDTTDAIPYYTNYAAGWPLSQWEGLRGAVSGDPEASNNLARIDSPWAADEEHGVIDGLIYDIVANGLSEPDPTTTDWELSKELLGTGEIATMVLGSWAITQMQDAADDPADIGYMPFPTQKDGTFYVPVAGDGMQGINKHSDNKATARAWIEFIAGESGFAASQGGIPPLIGSEYPDTLADLAADNVEFLTLNIAPVEEEGLVDAIDNQAEIGLWGDTYRSRLIDIARGQADGDKASYFAELNERWAEARAAVEG